MSVFAFFAFLFIFFAWTRALNRFRGKLMSLREFSFWTVIWIGAAAVVAWPGYSGVIAERLGIGRGADVVVYVSILLIFYLLFRIYAYISIIEREITRLVRALAIENKHEHKK